MEIDVQDYDWMLTIKQNVDINGNSSAIPFEVTFGEDNRVKVVIDWDKWGLASVPPGAMPPVAKVRQAALKAGEQLAAGADERRVSVASALKEYGEQYTTEIGRLERGQQLG